MTRVTFFRFLALSMFVAANSIAFGQAPRDRPVGLFNHEALHVRDVPKSAGFYSEVLGLERMPDPFNDDHHMFLQMGSQSALHLIGGATKVEHQDIDHHMAFSVPSIQEFIKRLELLHIQYYSTKSEEGKITIRPDGVKQVYFQDPDGYWIEVNDATQR